MPMPVLPEVGSISVSPGLMRPCFSASSSMRTPMRSLTEPPGFMNSHLPSSSHGRSRPMRESRTIGVWPQVSRIESRMGDGSVMARAVYDEDGTLSLLGVHALHGFAHSVVDAQIGAHHPGRVKYLLHDDAAVLVVSCVDERGGEPLDEAAGHAGPVRDRVARNRGSRCE